MQKYNKVISFVLTLAIVATTLIAPFMVVPAYAESEEHRLYLTSQLRKYANSTTQIDTKDGCTSTTAFYCAVGFTNNSTQEDYTMRTYSIVVKHNSDIKLDTDCTDSNYAGGYVEYKKLGWPEGVELKSVVDNGTSVTISGGNKDGLIDTSQYLQGHVNYCTAFDFCTLRFIPANKDLTKAEFEAALNSIQIDVVNSVVNRKNGTLKLVATPGLLVELKNNPEKIYANTTSYGIIDAYVSSATYVDNSGATNNIELHSDNFAIELPNNYTINPTEAGQTRTVTAVYTSGGVKYQYEFDVKVYTPAVSAFVIENAPSKVEYTAGERFSTNGLTVKIKYVNGTEEDVTNKSEYYPNLTSPLAINVTNVAISYGGRTTYQAISVTKNAFDLYISPIAVQVYSGTAIEPVLDFGSTHAAMVKGVDYEVEYSSNTAVGTVTLTVSSISTGNYSFATKAAQFVITPKAIKVGSFFITSKNYDGNTEAEIYYPSREDAFLGAYSGDLSNIDYEYTAAFEDSKAGWSKPVTITVSALKLTGSAFSNYVLDPVGRISTMAGHIFKAPVQINGLVINDKVYDGTTRASFDISKATLGGVVAGETVSLSTVTGAFFDKSGTDYDKTAGDNKIVKIIDYKLSGTTADQYEIDTNTEYNATISKKAVTISSIKVKNKVFDGTRDAEFYDVVVSGYLPNDTVSHTAVGHFSDSIANNVGSDWTIYVTDLTFTGKDKDNYYLSTQDSCDVVANNGLRAVISQASVNIAPVAVQYLQSNTVTNQQQTYSFDLGEITTGFPSTPGAVTISAIFSNLPGCANASVEAFTISKTYTPAGATSPVTTYSTGYSLIVNINSPQQLNAKGSIHLDYEFLNYTNASVNISFEYSNYSPITVTQDAIEVNYGENYYPSILPKVTYGGVTYNVSKAACSFSYRPLESSGSFTNGFPKDAGVYAFKIQYSETSNSVNKNGYCITTLTIHPKKIQPTWEDIFTTYNGLAQNPTCILSSGDLVNISYTYGSINLVYDDTSFGNIEIYLYERNSSNTGYIATPVAVATNAGAYKLSASCSNTNYKINISNDSVYEIEKAELPSNVICVSLPAVLTYDPVYEKEIEIYVTDTAIGVGTISALFYKDGEKFTYYQGGKLYTESLTRKTSFKMEAGHYDIVVNMYNGINYLDVRGLTVASFTIEKITPQATRFVTSGSITYQYDGTPHGWTVTDYYQLNDSDDGIGDVTAMYRLSGSAIMSSAAPSDAGEYIVYASNRNVTDDDDYCMNYIEYDTVVGSFTINKKTAQTSDVYYAGSSVYRFDGKDKLPVVKATPSGLTIGKINTLYYQDGSQGSVTHVQVTPNSIGTYCVYATIEDSTNYNGIASEFKVCEFEITSGSFTKDDFTVSKPVDGYSFDSGNNIYKTTYDGKSKALIVKANDSVSSLVGNFSVKYQLSGTAILLDAITNAGIYDVFVCISGVEGFKDANISVAAIEIEKKTPVASDLVFITPSSFGYTGSEIAASAKAISSYSGLGEITFRYVQSGKPVSPKNQGTYDVYAVIAEGTNFTSSDGIEIGKITITKGTPTKDVIKVETASGLVYDGTAKVATVSAATGVVGLATVTAVYRFGSSTGAIVDKPTAVGTYYVFANVQEGSNYKAANNIYLDTCFTILGRNRTLTVPSNVILVKGNLTTTVALSVSSGSASYKLESSDSTAVKVEGTKITALKNAKGVVITATAIAGDNYNETSKAFTVDAYVEPLLSVTASSVGGDVSAKISGGKIVVTGHRMYANGITYEISSYGGTQFAYTDNTLTITVASVGVKYTIDTTGVNVLPVEVKEIKATDNAVTYSGIASGDQTKVETALKSTSVKAISAADEYIENSLDKVISDMGITSKEGIEVSVLVSAKVEATGFTSTQFALDITPQYMVVVSKGGVETPSAFMDIPNDALKEPVEVSVKVPTGFAPTLAKHYLSDTTWEYIKVTVDQTTSIASWKQSSFSKVELLTPEKMNEVTFALANGSELVKVYSSFNSTETLPTDSKSNYTFNGWVIKRGGVAVTSTVTSMTETILEAISTGAITAEGQFTYNGGGGGGFIGGGGGGFIGGGGGGGATPKQEEKVEVQKVQDVWLDVKANEYYTTPMQWCLEKSILDPETSTQFGIGQLADRADLIMALYRACSSPAVASTAKMPFTDVKTTDACYKAVLWAYSRGIIEGQTPTTFNPRGILCRADLVTILWNYDGRKTKKGTIVFEDVVKGAYYEKAIDWATSVKLDAGSTAKTLVDGATETTFDPMRDINKQDTITLYYRYIVEYLKQN